MLRIILQQQDRFLERPARTLSVAGRLEDAADIQQAGRAVR